MDNLITRSIWLLVQPSNLLFILLLLASFLIWRGRKKLGKGIIAACMVTYAMTMFGVLNNILMVYLEERFSNYTNVVSDTPYSGIIVMAGTERLTYSTYHNQVTLNGAAERLIETAKLARQFPHLPIIFCGGGKRKNMLSETDVARKFFTEAGIDISRIRFDDHSYNSYTNAIEARKYIKDTEKEKWLLVTSAFHMPRAVGAYRKAGINIQPYPVDYRSDLNALSIHSPNTGRNLYELDFAVHEWVGLLVYYIRGYSDDLFPAPLNNI